ncbi:hypothetical protein [Leptospira harrisiae]|uniref:hypothetical protein n=1 Tax=Leptospira harrisiae TaxID=2023189 RepID=UPI001FAF2D75|nr:hypothetical protein [Leptospira harrisiae]
MILKIQIYVFFSVKTQKARLQIKPEDAGTVESIQIEKIESKVLNKEVEKERKILSAIFLSPYFKEK